jgi:methionine sulfoxide reductase heme-binding subunit
MSVQAASRSSTRLGHPLGTTGDWRRRLLFHHVPLALASAVALVMFISLSLFTTGGYAELDIGAGGAFPQQRTIRAMNMNMGMNHGERQTARRTLRFEFPSHISESQMTKATGYVATGLIALTLLIGPANLLLRRRNPLSSYLRRDVGMWAAIFSAVHVIFALQLHGDGQILDFRKYFVAPDGRPWLNSFGLGNWTGLAALVIVTGLLALSTDGALRELKAKTWKDLQRLNYTLFALVIAHAFFYGALLRTTSPFTLLLIFIVIAVVVGQMVGIWLWRRRYSRTIAKLA